MKNNKYKRLFLKFFIAGMACLSVIFPLKAQNFPPGFSQVKVGTIWYPTAMAFAPDGRIFATEKAGKVRVVKNGAVLPANFLQVQVEELNERGLGGIALDPDFSNNGYVYIYYTTAAGGYIHNRLSRFTASGDVAAPGSEVVIHDFEVSVNSIHTGGGMEFGPDGKLYIAIGNDNVNSHSQDLSNHMGKVLRVNKDFSIPSGNPFTTGSDAQKRIWAYGLRNPWTVAFQPGTGRFFVNDVGEGAWEEINDATTGGKNFGWPGSEGPTSNPAYTSPVFAYKHGFNGSSNDGCAITGGTFFNPAATNYPAQYKGKYFFIEYCNNWINYIDVDNGYQKHDFATSLPGAGNYIKVSPDGNLYYFSISQNALYKIIYSTNDAPLITTHPSDLNLPEGQPATFAVTASGKAPFSYQWKKNGTNIPGANSSSYTIGSVVYADAGQYSTEVSNSFGKVTSNPATLTVTAYNARPKASIITPAAGTIYRGGDMINFSGDATDAEDGNLPASAFQWYIDFHHDTHTHPGPNVNPGVKSGTFPIANAGEVSANVFYRLYLVVTDSRGLKDTAYVDILPKTSTIYLTTQPPGLEVLLDGQPHLTPYSVLAVSGIMRTLDVPEPQAFKDTSWVFAYWTQGGTKSQFITVGDADATYTAYFNANGVIGINEPAEAPDIKIFPNPSYGNFTISLGPAALATEKKLSIRILNITGEEVYRKEFEVKNTLVKKPVELNGAFPPGVYMLELNMGEKIVNTRIVLLK